MAPPLVKAKPRHYFHAFDRNRRLLAIAATILGAIYGYWKAGIVGALLAGPAAGAAMIALVTLVPVGASIAVVALALMFTFLLYALVYHALNP
jgi:hypothetical protein